MISFMTIGDKKFFNIILHSIRQINSLYPSSRFFVYDWGFTEKQLKNINGFENVKVIDWKSKIDPLGYRSYKTVDDGHKEYLFCQKPICMLDCAGRVKENLVFLDGDAFLINKIDEIFDDSFDVGVTLRSDPVNRKGFCQLLNSGVVFFNTSSRKMKSFIGLWIEIMEKTNEYLIEQTSLSRLIEGSGKNIFKGYYRTGTLNAGDYEIKVKVFPCEIYNYNWMEGFDDKKVKILHFKDARKEKFLLERKTRRSFGSKTRPSILKCVKRYRERKKKEKQEE